MLCSYIVDWFNPTRLLTINRQNLLHGLDALGGFLNFLSPVYTTRFLGLALLNFGNFGRGDGEDEGGVGKEKARKN